jgi:hypothetical protein
MRGIFKRLAPVLLFLGFLVSGVQAKEREILNFDYNWANEFIVVVTLEDYEICTQTTINSNIAYLIDGPAYFGVEVTSNPPAATKYEVSVNFLDKQGESYHEAFTSLNKKEGKFAPTKEYVKIQIEILRYKYSSNKWTLDETIKTSVIIKYDINVYNFYYSYSTGNARKTNAASVTIGILSEKVVMDNYKDFFSYKVNNGNTINGYSATLTNEGTHNVKFYFRTSPEDTLHELSPEPVTIDRTKPVLDVAGLPSGAWTGGAVTLVPSATDALTGLDSSTWRYSENGGTTWKSLSAGNLSYAVSGEGTTNVVFSVKDSVGNEATKSVTVRIDKTAPSVSLAGNLGENVWSRDTSRTLRVTASDSLSGMGSLETRLNDGSWTKEANAAAASFTYTGEGIFRREIRATDAAGNTTTSASVISLDRRGPVISGFSFPSEWTRLEHLFSGIKITDSTAVTTSVSGVDPASFTVTPDGKSAIPVTVSYNASTGVLAAFTLPGLSNGSYSLTFSAKDKVGNVSTSVIQAVRIDTTAPQISAAAGSIVWKGNSWTIPVKIKIVKEEHSGINPAGWKYKIDEGNFVTLTLSLLNGEYIGDIVVSSLTGGNHTLSVVGADNAGNEASSQTSFKIDDTPPVINYNTLFGTTPENAPWTNVRTFAVSAEDTGSGIREFTAGIKRGLSNGQWAETGDAVFNNTNITFLEGISDGIFQFKFRAVDNAANVKEEIRYARIDRTGPVITVPSGLIGTSTVTALAEDASSGIDGESWEWREVKNGGGSWQKGKTATLPEGKDRVVSFRLKDKAGNLSERSAELTVDLTPPEISAEVPEYACRESLGIKISARDEITAVKKLWYSVDNSSLREISGWSAVQTQIPVESYQEGTHLLRLTAEDSVARRGQSEDYTFIIDRTAPEIEAVEIRPKLEPGRLLGDFDFSASTEVQIKLRGSDKYADRGTLRAGKITAWYWNLSQNKDSIPVFPESGKKLVPEFNISGLREGPNYIYFRTEDACGNFSAVFRRIVSVDLAIPGSPIIRSTTHPEAWIVEQAFPFPVTEFVFRPPVNVLSGIRRYQWRLEKVFIYGGVAGTGRTVEQGSTEKLNASLEGKLSLTLEDNQENEFYRLFVSCTASNGNTSGESVYQFRIDTASPNEVRVITVPQIDRKEWYRDTYSLVMWNQPADMTGVAEYRYLVSADEGWILPDDSSLQEYDLSGWYKTTDTELYCDLRPYLNGKGSGIIRIAVCAIDYAGNRRLGTTSINCDFISPAFENTGGELIRIADTVADIGKAKYISWNKITDEDSGLDNISLSVINTDNPEGSKLVRTVILPSDTVKFTLDRLEDNSVYVLQFIVSDKAGNQLTLHRPFVTGNRELPSRFEVPYEETINGFALSGKRITGVGNDEFEDVYLAIPGTMQVYEIRTINGEEKRNRLDTIRLEEITITENMFSSGKSGKGRYEASADGFNIEGGYIGFDRETGAVLLESRYIRPFMLKGTRQSAAIGIGQTGLGFPPVARFSSGAGALGGQAVIETYSTAADNGEIPGFPLTKAESLRLDAGKEWFYGTAVSFDSSMLERHGISFTAADGSRETPVSESRASAESRNIRANIRVNPAEPPMLNIRGTSFTVKAAGIRGHFIDIYEAVLDLPAGYDIRKLTVRNFIIDAQNGTVANGPDFSSDPVNAEVPNGGRFESTSVKFTPDGKLRISGIITSDIYGTIQTSNFVLTNNGLDWDEGGAISGFTAMVHGFPIIAITARFVREGIFIEQGEILHGGARRQFIDLGLVHQQKDNVFSDGTITERYYLENGYGNPVLVKDGRITDEGVLGAVIVPLGIMVTEVTGRESWEFPAVTFDPSGGMRGFYPGSDNIIIGGFEFTPDDIEFLGNHIKIGTLRSCSIPGMNPAILEFNDFCFTETVILAENLPSESAEYLVHGWKIAYNALALTRQGLKGVGALLLPETLGGFAIEFQESLILGSGGIISGKAEKYACSAAIRGVPVELPDAELELRGNKLVLACATPLIRLALEDPVEIRFGKTCFDSSGLAASGEEGKERIRFTSSNGYRVDSASYVIAQDGIRLDGSLGAKWWDENTKIAVANKGIELLSGFAVVSGEIDTEFSYCYGDWTIQAGGAAFGLRVLEVAANTIKYRGIGIQLGPLSYTTEGLLAREGERIQDLELGSFAGATVKLAESRFGQTWLTGSVFVTMPRPFNSHTLYYENVKLGADGSFGIENEIEKYQLSLGGFGFSFEGITVNTTGIYIQGAGVTLPSSMEDARLRLAGLRLSDGSLNLDNSFINPVKIWGMLFSLDDFSIKDGTVILSGAVNLPETMPGTLAGRKLIIRDFTAGLEGGIKSLDIRMDEECTIPFLDAWDLSLNNLMIRYTDGQPWIFLNNASLRFPTGFAANDAAIEQVKFDPIQGKFDFDSIKANTNIKLGFAGISFNLTQLWLDKETAFGFKGSITLPVAGMPAFLAGRTAEIDSFSIKKDGSLGVVSASLKELNGEILSDTKGVMLQDGSLVVNAKNGRDIELSITGDIIMTGNMPGSLAGSRLSIDTFTINPAIPAISQFKANASFPSVEIYDIAFSGIQIDVYWDSAKQNGLIGLSGKVIFPASFPKYLAGKSTEIRDFRIGLDGNIGVFDVSYTTEPGVAFDIIGAVQMKDTVISLYREKEKFGIDMAGTILFPADKFPKGLGGLTTKTVISFDTIKGIKTLYAKIDVPNQKLFDSLTMRDAKLVIDKQEDHPAEISLQGSLELPDFFPQGLRGLVINIKTFTISTNGNISDIDVSASGINTKIFNTVDLKNGSIKFQKGGKEEFILDVSGRVKLAAAGLPAALREPELVIGTLSLSTRTGLRTFDIELAAGISFDFLGGFKINVTSLQLGDGGISLSANITLPSYFPVGIANSRIDLTVFKLGWDGRVADIQGGMGKLELQIAGFQAKIDSLYFEKDPVKQFYVSLRSCRILFPAYLGSLGGKEFALKNARFSPDGSFEGDFEVPKLAMDIAGFGMELIDPVLEFTNRQISFSQVKLKMPDFIKGVEINLPGVKISEARGIEVDGGEFRLPEFPVGGLLFSNIFVKFTFSGSDYIIGGGGKVLIPGAGNIEATLIFASRSSLYPIGLKQAEFSWQAAMGGIPLGNSGLAISGISGGITYGSPDEVPTTVKNMFDPKGPRVKLGLYINDLYGGNVISMNPNVWVDINNANWAFKGDASILSGFIHADVTAALTGNGFYGGLYVELRFVRGGVDIYIFDKSGKTIFSGSGYVEFGIPRGFIADTTVLFVPVVIPPSDWFFGSFNADFGRFTNGKDGFKASVDIPVIGQVGIFVGNGIFDVGNVSSYTIEKPSWSAPSLRGSIRRSVSNPGIISNDISDYGGITDTNYTVNVYGKNLERVVFMLVYVEGDPAVTFTSPSGKKYSEQEDNIETVLYENFTAFIIHDPEQGIWQIRVENAEEETYRLSVLGTERTPSLVITEPDFRTELVQDEFVLSGQAERGYNSIIVKAREDRGKPGLELGVFPVESDGSFELLVPVEGIADGEYVISAELVTGDEFTVPAAYAPGKIRVDRSGLPLLEPEPVRIAETDRGTVVLRWENNNGARTAGYNVKIVNRTTGSENTIYVGNITSFILPGFGAGEEISFQVATVDGNRQESAYSAPIGIITGNKRPTINRPMIRDGLSGVEGVAGKIVEGSVTVSIEEYEESYEASGYILARLRKTETNTPGTLYFTGPIKIEQKTVTIPWRLSLPAGTVPGVYSYPCEAVNEANGELSAPFVLEVRVRWPDPEIHNVNPAKFNGAIEQLITLYGSGFVPGTRVMFSGSELALNPDKGEWSTSVMEALFPAQKQGGTYPLTVIGPGGKSASFDITVSLPDWYAELYNRTVETVPGGDADYWLGVTGIEGFTGTASFTVIEKPEILDITLPVIPAGNTGNIRIHVHSDTTPGTYRSIISGGEGKNFELITVVCENTPAPRLNAVSPAQGYPLSEVSLYGSSLGSGGNLYLNNVQADILSWSNSKITFTVPENGESGTVRVITGAENGGMESNALPFTVRRRGFSLRPETSHLEMSAGEKRKLTLILSGYSDAVNLRIETGDAPLSAALNRSSAVPNAALELEIGVNDSNGVYVNGSWKIRIVGNSENYQAETEITVRVADAPELLNRVLPDGLAEVSYYEKLTLKRGDGKVEYRVSGGELPPGLELSVEGEIHGKPRHTGRYQAEIALIDSAGRKGNGTVIITIWEESWAQADKDGGKSRSINTELPAGNEVLFTVQASILPDYILAAEEKVILVSRAGITVIRASNGRTDWNLAGNYQQVIYAGGKLYALTSQGVLETRDLDLGTLLWSREGVRSFSSDGVIVLAETDNTRLFLDAALGFLRERKEKEYDNTSSILWMNHEAYEINKNRITAVNGQGSSPEFDHRILAAAADSAGMAVITEKSLVILDRKLHEAARIERAFSGTVELALNADTVFVSEKGLVRGYGRDKPDLIHEWPFDGEGIADIAVGNGSLVILGKEGFTVMNCFNGKALWRESGSYRRFMLYREKIYAADGEGIIRVYGGSTNPQGPETEIVLEPAAPDGRNGWYITTPSLRITSVDRETFTASVAAWLDGEELENPESGLPLPDGEHQISAYGVDSRGLRSPIERFQVKVDTASPKSELVLSEEEPESGWYKGPVKLEIEAWDDTSGIERIWTNNGNYNGPVSFNTQGIHSFSWYAIDRAGNQEETHQYMVRVDYEEPFIDAEIQLDRGIGELNLRAEDSVSGVDVIEYRLNGGAAEIYRERIFLDEGNYRLEYRAMDRAGNYSEWKTAEFTVQPLWAEASLIVDASIGGIKRVAVTNLRNGMPILRENSEKPGINRLSSHALVNLPSYVIGAEYIIWEPEDVLAGEGNAGKERVISFRVAKDAVAYLFLPEGNEAPASWSPVRENAMINRNWYGEGVSLYMKRLTGESRIDIPVTGAAKLPPLIAVQERGSISADIVIRRSEDKENKADDLNGIDMPVIEQPGFIEEYEAGTELLLDGRPSPWRYSRRLPLIKKWYVSYQTEWLPLEENRWTIPEDADPGYIRFRLELATPDGQVEYRTEKTIGIVGEKVTI